MTALGSVLEPVARIVVATLFNSLWEAALLVAFVALVLRLLPNVSATTRYAAWCVALVASLLLPLATALPQINVQHTSAHVAATHSGAAVQHIRAVPSTPHRAAVPPASRPNANALQPAQREHSGAGAPAFALPGRPHFSLPQYVALVVFALWGAAALLLLIRLAVNLWRLERLKRDALPLPVEYRERLDRWSGADKGEREVRLCICENIEVPIAVGLFDSMILLPRHLLESLSQSEIDQIILHELAHLRRADDWTNGVQRFIQALFFFNPAVLYIAQQLDLEREVACDDWVVDQTKEVRPYATCLTKMAEVTAWPHRPLAAPGVFLTRRGLSVRVERLLRAGRNIRTSVAFGPTGAVVAALIVLFFVLQNVAPSFAFTLPQDESQAHAALQSSAHGATSRHASVPGAPLQQLQQHEKVVYEYVTASPSPKASAGSRVITIPARHIHIPPIDIHRPAVNIDLPPQRFTVPAVRPVPHVRFSMPPDFAQHMAGLSQTISRSIKQSVAQAFDGRQGHYTCVGCDFSSKNLAGRSFRGQALNGADFSHANLQNADFSHTVLIGADFSGANLQGATFAHATLTGCDLHGANVSGVNFDGVSMLGCDIDAGALTSSQAGALLHACRKGCDFSRADLRNQDLRNISLTGVDLSHADLRGADLSGAQLEGVNFAGARMDGVRLNGATLTGCDFSGVDLRTVDFSNAKMTGDKMTDSNE